jgi:hypothetical protein
LILKIFGSKSQIPTPFGNISLNKHFSFQNPSFLFCHVFYNIPLGQTVSYACLHPFPKAALLRQPDPAFAGFGNISQETVLPAVTAA